MCSPVVLRSPSRQVLGMIGVLHGMAPERFSVQINARDRGGSAVANLLEADLSAGIGGAGVF